MTRRESIRELAKISGAIALGGALFRALPPESRAAERAGLVVEAVGESRQYTVEALTRQAFDAAGGIRAFIAKGDVVAIKANLSWARSPELAATTNPEVLEAVVRLCQEAGAKKVRILDNTINDARRCFAVTGAGRVARKTGAELVFPRSSLMRKMNLHGHRLAVWPVYVPLVEADKRINLPIAKHHSLTTLTLGMKNWIGGVDGGRWSLHQDIDQSIVDLAQFFKPTLTLIDAIRILRRNGPSGGSAADIAVKNTLILSNDPVAADAAATRLFGIRPEEVGFVRLGQKWGLGTFDPEKLDRKRVIV